MTRVEFNSRIRKTPTCWLWVRLSGKTAKHYMEVKTNGRRTLAHRLALEFKIGRELRGKEQSLHSCDNPACVRPSHLFLGTQSDNMDDKVAKCRQVRGEQHWQTILTPRDIRRIRFEVVRRPNGRFKGTATIAKRLGVGRGTILDIVRRKTWRHVK